MNYAFLISLTITIFFSIFFLVQTGANSQDYNNFWSCITNGYFSSGEPDSCKTYPPLFMIIGGFFSAREIMFKQFLIVFTFLIFPVVLSKISRNPLTAWFYFSTTNFSFALITSSFFAQALSMLLILCMYFLKDRERIVILFLSIITHSTGFFVALPFFLFLKLQDILKETGFDFKKKFWFCSPIFGEKLPDLLNTRLINFNPDLKVGYVSFNTILSVFFKRVPIFFLAPGVIGLLNRREVALLFFMALSFAGGLLIHERGFYFAALPMVVGLTWFCESHPKFLKPVLAASFIFFLFNLWQYLEILKCNQLI